MSLFCLFIVTYKIDIVSEMIKQLHKDKYIHEMPFNKINILKTG